MSRKDFPKDGSLKMRLKRLGQKNPRHSEWMKTNNPRKGKRHPPEMIEYMKYMANKRVREGRHNCYKGGITPINKKIRNSSEYKIWRRAVLERDNYTCVWCSCKEKLHADHIKPFYLFPELRFAIDNGRTLCEPCHKTTDTWGRPNVY